MGQWIPEVDAKQIRSKEQMVSRSQSPNYKPFWKVRQCSMFNIILYSVTMWRWRGAYYFQLRYLSEGFHLALPEIL